MIKYITKTTKNESKSERKGFLGMLLDTLDASLLGNILEGKGVIKDGKGVIRAEQIFLILLLPLTNFEI